MNYVRGTNLHHDDKRHVLAAYVHRFTGQHKPTWACKPMPNGGVYPVQHLDDADWLANTMFAVKKNGRLDNRANHCVSTPSWPFNPELRRIAA